MPNTKLNITRSFFELQSPDFAWKFIWTDQPNDKVQKVQEVQEVQEVQNVQKYKS